MTARAGAVSAPPDLSPRRMLSPLARPPSVPLPDLVDVSFNIASWGLGFKGGLQITCEVRHFVRYVVFSCFIVFGSILFVFGVIFLSV